MQRIKTIRKVFLFLTVCVVITACVEIQKESPIPEIEFKSMTFGTNSNSGVGNPYYGVIEFSFIDGDADLGVYDVVNADTTLPDSVRFGIFVSFFEKVHGQYYERFFTATKTIQIKKSVKVGDSVIVTFRDSIIIDTNTFNCLLPYDSKMDRVGQNKVIKGNIRDTVQFLAAELPYDTMRFEFYIRDRALHKSNVAVTNDFTNSDISGR